MCTNIPGLLLSILTVHLRPECLFVSALAHSPDHTLAGWGVTENDIKMYLAPHLWCAVSDRQLEAWMNQASLRSSAWSHPRCSPWVKLSRSSPELTRIEEHRFAFFKNICFLLIHVSLSADILLPVTSLGPSSSPTYHIT